MPKYNVHLYREMKLRFDDIEADSPEEAAKFVSHLETKKANTVEDCEGNDIAAVVDLVGDDDFTHSKLIEFYSMLKKEI